VSSEGKCHTVDRDEETREDEGADWILIEDTTRAPSLSPGGYKKSASLLTEDTTRAILIEDTTRTFSTRALSCC
jgi:hypothetical protein